MTAAPPDYFIAITSIFVVWLIVWGIVFSAGALLYTWCEDRIGDLLSAWLVVGIFSAFLYLVASLYAIVVG